MAIKVITATSRKKEDLEKELSDLENEGWQLAGAAGQYVFMTKTAVSNLKRQQTAR